MKWVDTTDNTLFNKDGHFTCKCEWLEGYDKDHCAEYTIRYEKHRNCWYPQWWHGNRGYDMGFDFNSLLSFDEAKMACRMHLEELLSNIEKTLEASDGE